MKRTFDFLLAAAMLVPATLVVLLAAIFVRLETPGSPLFVQTRVGRNERLFSMLKLRTMRAGTAMGASHEVGAATVTRVGKILRRTKIDELPQIWSVLVGDMSFVGPRPCLPMQSELVKARRALGVFALRPGITGKAQVKGVDMSEPARLAKIDAEYVRHHSLAGDIGLMVATVAGKGYYDAADR